MTIAYLYTNCNITSDAEEKMKKKVEKIIMDILYCRDFLFVHPCITTASFSKTGD